MGWKALPVLLCMVAGLTSGEAWSRTFYVEIFGDINVECSRARPCDSISYAISLAGSNDRVLVGPGLYSGSVVLMEPGVKLISIAGSRATSVFTSPGMMAVDVDFMADRAVIGQRGKGFSFVGAFNGTDGIRVAAKRVKVEGNSILGNAAGGSAITVTGSGTAIRNNQVNGFGIGIHFPSGMEKSKHLVSDNHIAQTSSHCIQLSSGQRSNNRVRDNVLDSCGGWGIDVITTADNAISGDVIQNNAIDFAVTGGINVAGGNPRVQRNFVNTLGTDGIAVNETSSARIQDNLVDYSINALALGAANEKLAVTGNTVVSASHGVQLDANAIVPSSFSRNNFYDIAICALEFANATVQGEMVLSRNFWGDTQSPLPDLSCDAESNSLYLGGVQLRMSPSALPNPVKYRGGI